MPTWIWLYEARKAYRVRNQHLRATIHWMNPNQELPSFLSERNKIHDWNREKGGEPFKSTEACIEKVAKAMDKANETLLTWVAGKVECGGPREDRWGAERCEASNEQASTEPREDRWAAEGLASNGKASSEKAESYERRGICAPDV